MFSPLHFLGGAFLGWSIGGMDFAALFGAAVSAKMVRYWHGVILACLFCLAGCLFQGYQGIETIGSLTSQSLATAFISSIAAAIAITVLNFFKLPIPTSQAVVGSIAGIAVVTGTFSLSAFGRVFLCWLATPILACILAVPLYFILGQIINRFNFNIFQRDIFYRISLIAVGCYASYAMGANTVANVGAVFVSSGALTPFQAAFLGGVFILAGIATFSKRIVDTVGHGIVHLDSFSAFAAVLAEALTVHFFAFIGIPVSLTQALIGAIVGIGLIRGVKSIKARNLRSIILGWLVVPVFAFLLSFGTFCLCKAFYPSLF